MSTFTPTVIKRNFYPLYVKIFRPIILTERVYYEIPVTIDEGDNTFETELGGVRLRFRFNFNRRLGRWIMSIADENGDMIVEGRAVVNGIDLIGQYTDSRLPAGSIIALNSDTATQQGVDAGEFDLGDRVRVYYAQQEPITT